MLFTPPPGATKNEYGYYVDANGALLPGQSTPGQRGADAMGLTPQYDAQKGLWYTNPKGQGKNYISPVVMSGPSGKPQPYKDSGGGLVNHPSWNNKTGQWDQGLNWGNIMALVIAGTLTMGAAAELMGGGEAATEALSTLPAGSSVPGAEAGLASALPGATSSIPGLAGTGIGTLPTVASGPVLEGLAAGPGATTLPAGGTMADVAGTGVQPGLLGPSMESATDVYGAVGPTAAKTGLSSLLSSPWSDIIKTGVGAGLSIWGVNKQADATTAAAQAQAQAARDALNFQIQQANQTQANFLATQDANYGQYVAHSHNVQPFHTIGVDAVNTMGDLLGTPVNAPTQLDIPANPFANANTGPAFQPITPPGQTPPAATPGGSPARPSSTLSDPSKWMALVNDPNARAAFVRQSLGPSAPQSLVDYYSTKIQGQPGANPTEQAGSANFWYDKMRSDPLFTGQSASRVGTGSPLAPRPFQVPVTPAPMPAPAPGVVPLPTVAPLPAPSYLSPMGSLL